MDDDAPTGETATTPRAQEKTGDFDARERVVIHRAFRREIRLLAELISTVKPGDTARARILVGHFADVRTGVQNHYESEPPKSKLLKFFGMVMEDADPAERTVLVKGLLAPARPVWFLIGRPRYARTVRSIRLTP